MRVVFQLPASRPHDTHITRETHSVSTHRLNVRINEAEMRVVFQLPAVGPGMALIALWRLFQELAGRVAT